MTTIYKLYIKTHNKTGLKYLGFTKSNDPHKYKGSGIYWKNHINLHGYDVSTEVILETTNHAEVKSAGLHYSNLWNVVDSDEWANLKPESGDGGCIGHTNETRAKISRLGKGLKRSAITCQRISKGQTGKHISVETRAKMSKSHTGLKASNETRQKMSTQRKGRQGKPNSPETRAKLSMAAKGRVLSADHKAKTSEKMKEYWVRKKALALH